MSDRIAEQEVLLAYDPKPLTGLYSLRLMYQFLSPSDSLLLSLGLVATVLFSCSPIGIDLAILSVISSASEYAADKAELYSSQKTLALQIFVLGLLTLVLSWASIVAFISVSNRQLLEWKSRYFA
jgi:hypothetical protein